MELASGAVGLMGLKHGEFTTKSSDMTPVSVHIFTYDWNCTPKLTV